MGLAANVSNYATDRNQAHDDFQREQAGIHNNFTQQQIDNKADDSLAYAKLLNQQQIAQGHDDTKIKTTDVVTGTQKEIAANKLKQGDDHFTKKLDVEKGKIEGGYSMKELAIQAAKERNDARIKEKSESTQKRIDFQKATAAEKMQRISEANSALAEARKAEQDLRDLRVRSKEAHAWDNRLPRPDSLDSDKAAFNAEKVRRQKNAAEIDLAIEQKKEEAFRAHHKAAQRVPHDIPPEDMGDNTVGDEGEAWGDNAGGDPQSANYPQIQSEQDYQMLQPGQHYLAPDGNLRMKREAFA